MYAAALSSKLLSRRSSQLRLSILLGATSSDPVRALEQLAQPKSANSHDAVSCFLCL